jgi:hypothetical protein
MVKQAWETRGGATRRRFWLAMVGCAMVLLLVPFSYRVAGDWNWWPLGLAGSSTMPEPERS